MENQKHSLSERLAKGRGKEIREAREALGWSQSDLAERAETSQQTVDRIERGVTGHSRAYPLIRAALGLGEEEGFNRDRTEKLLRAIERTGEIQREKFETEIVQSPSNFSTSWLDDKELIPVYLCSRMLSGWEMSSEPVNALRRGSPVEHVKSAYGVISVEPEMEPAIRPGDIAIINPHLPIIPGFEVFFWHQDQNKKYGIIRTFIEETADYWIAKTWSKSFPEKLSKSEWLHAEMVVSKISRVR